MGSFSIEIAKEQIYSEINKNISENDAVKAYYIIGMKTAEVYSILADYTKFKRAVLRDKAGNDIADVNVSRYLAEKEEKKFQKNQKELKKEKINADESVNNARNEYEAAKAQLEEYEIKHGLRQEKVESVVSSPDKVELTKVEKAIEKTKKKLIHTHDKIKPEPISDLKTTLKRLDGLAVGTAMTSLRQKAIRDGGDNTGVEAANMAVTLAQTAYHYERKLHEKSLVEKEKKYEKKLQTLENQKSFESKLTESSNFKASESSGTKNKKPAINKKNQKQKKAIKKKQQKKVYEKFAKESAQKAKKIAAGSIKTAVSAISIPSGGAIAIAAVIIIVIVLLLLALVACGGSGLSTVYAGYDNHIYGDMALDYSIELQTYFGQEIICGMDGDVTKLSDNSFSVYNPKYGTLYYDYVTAPNVSKAKCGDVISSSIGDTLRIRKIAKRIFTAPYTAIRNKDISDIFVECREVIKRYHISTVWKFDYLFFDI